MQGMRVKFDVTQNYKDAVLVDRDERAIRFLRAKYGKKVRLVHDNFYNAALQQIECGKLLIF